jgi:hypothetical protein
LLLIVAWLVLNDNILALAVIGDLHSFSIVAIDEFLTLVLEKLPPFGMRAVDLHIG